MRRLLLHVLFVDLRYCACPIHFSSLSVALALSTLLYVLCPRCVQTHNNTIGKIMIFDSNRSHQISLNPLLVSTSLVHQTANPKISKSNATRKRSEMKTKSTSIRLPWITWVNDTHSNQWIANKYSLRYSIVLESSTKQQNNYKLIKIKIHCIRMRSIILELFVSLFFFFFFALELLKHFCLFFAVHHTNKQTATCNLFFFFFVVFSLE